MSVHVHLESSGDDSMVAAQVAFHLAAGADRVVVAAAGDGVAERRLLGPFTEMGAVSVVPRRESAIVDRAEWRIEAAPGEFWWPSYGPLRDTLALVPPRFRAVQVAVRTFSALPADDAHFAERNVSRVARASLRELLGLEPTGRALPTVLRGWFPFEVLCVPGDTTVAQQPAEPGWTLVDTRLRDALRALAGVARLETRTFFDPSRVLEGLTFTTPSVTEETRLVVDLQKAIAADGPTSLERRTAHLDERVRRLETGLTGALTKAFSARAARLAPWR